MIEQILTIIGQYAATWGYLVVFLVMFFENSIFLGAFVPGETMALLSGFYAAQGIMSWYWLIIIITVGAVLGDNVGFLLGRYKGKRWLVKIGKYFGYREKKIEKAQEFWKDYGPKAIFIGRYITIARTFVPFLAGTSKIKHSTFFVYDFFGAFTWATIHVLLGYFFGENIEIIKTTFGTLGIILFIGLLIFVYKYLVRKGVEKIED